MRRPASQIRRFAGKIKHDTLLEVTELLTQAGVDTNLSASSVEDAAVHTVQTETGMNRFFCLDLDPLPDGENGVILG